MVFIVPSLSDYNVHDDDLDDHDDYDDHYHHQAAQLVVDTTTVQ